MAVLFLVLSQKCECSKKDSNAYNIYVMAKIKPLTLLCFAKEDLEKVMLDPEELGFLANEGKCFLEEKAKKVRLIASLASPVSDKAKLYTISMQGLKQEVHVVSEQLIFTEIWQRVFIPEERLLFNCKTSRQCEELVDKLEKGEEVPKELGQIQVTKSKEISASQKNGKDEQHSARPEKPRARLYPFFFNW